MKLRLFCLTGEIKYVCVNCSESLVCALLKMFSLSFPHTLLLFRKKQHIYTPKCRPQALRYAAERQTHGHLANKQTNNDRAENETKENLTNYCHREVLSERVKQVGLFRFISEYAYIPFFR